MERGITNYSLDENVDKCYLFQKCIIFCKLHAMTFLECFIRSFSNLFPWKAVVRRKIKEGVFFFTSY